MKTEGIPLEEFWEKDDGVGMGGLIRIERFIKSCGTKSAGIWGVWWDVKQLLKAALRYSESAPTSTNETGDFFYSHNTASPKLPLIVESNHICIYCVNGDKKEFMCSGCVPEYSLFKGRQLRA